MDMVLFLFIFVRNFHLRCFVIMCICNFINISIFHISQLHESRVYSRKAVVFIKHRSSLDFAYPMN